MIFTSNITAFAQSILLPESFKLKPRDTCDTGGLRIKASTWTREDDELQFYRKRVSI